uniref:Uncharacterized protein n=1 Tax=Arundo donax TaxID=35708 RepID=A0A0A8YN56_ARUDO
MALNGSTTCHSPRSTPVDVKTTRSKTILRGQTVSVTLFTASTSASISSSSCYNGLQVMGGVKHTEAIHARILESDKLIKIRKKYFLYSLLWVQVEHVRTHRRVGGLEPGHDGTVGVVEEVRERERLRRPATPEERRAALVEVPRHPRVQLSAPGWHRAGATQGGGRVGAHGRPAEEDEQEGGGDGAGEGRRRCLGAGKGVGNGVGDVVVGEVEEEERLGGGNLGGNAAGDGVAAEVETDELGEVGDGGRDGAGEAVVARIE